MAYREQNSASNITNIATYPITATNVQDALNELLTFVGSSKYQEPVLDIQVDATLDPGASPATGARYILEDTGALHANFGTISGVGDDDIVEYDGADFIISYDASAEGEGGISWASDENQFYVFNGSAWVTLSSTLTIPAPTTVETTVISSGPYAVLATDDFIAADPSGGSFTINLEASPADGRRITVKDSSGAASGSLKVTVSAGAKTIDGVSSVEIKTAYTALGFVYEASLDEWFLV